MEKVPQKTEKLKKGQVNRMAFAKILDFWRRLKTRYEAPKRY